MSCSCDEVPCRCQRFTPGGKTADYLQAPLDAARNVMAAIGLRPYTVKIVHVRWTGAVIGDGREEVVRVREVLPVPEVGDLSGIIRQMTPAQVDEAGAIILSKVSAHYTEDDVLLRPRTGKPLPANEAAYYEVSWRATGERRRFAPVGGGGASFRAASSEWQVTLTLQKGARPRSGAHR